MLYVHADDACIVSGCVCNSYRPFRNTSVPITVVGFRFVWMMKAFQGVNTTLPYFSAIELAESRFGFTSGWTAAGSCNVRPVFVLIRVVSWCVAPVDVDVAVCVVSRCVNGCILFTGWWTCDGWAPESIAYVRVWSVSSLSVWCGASTESNKAPT